MSSTREQRFFIFCNAFCRKAFHICVRRGKYARFSAKPFSPCQWPCHESCPSSSLVRATTTTLDALSSVPYIMTSVSRRQSCLVSNLQALGSLQVQLTLTEHELDRVKVWMLLPCIAFHSRCLTKPVSPLPSPGLVSPCRWNTMCCKMTVTRPSCDTLMGT